MSTAFDCRAWETLLQMVAFAGCAALLGAFAAPGWGAALVRLVAAADVGVCLMFLANASNLSKGARPASSAHKYVQRSPAMPSDPARTDRRAFGAWVGAAASGALLRPWAASADSVGVGVRITARKRYLPRVKAIETQYKDDLGRLLEAGELKQAAAFVADKSPWKEEAKSAMLLLASSFRTSEGQRPEKVPQNIKARAFLDCTGAFAKAAMAGDVPAAKAKYQEGLELLDEYMASVADVRSFSG